MSEPRDHQIVVNIEATLYEATQVAARKNGDSTSTYVRNLIIRDLLARGMMSERALAQILIGRQ